MKTDKRGVRDLLREPFDVFHQVLHRKDQPPVWPQVQLLHDIRNADQVPRMKQETSVLSPLSSSIIHPPTIHPSWPCTRMYRMSMDTS